MTQKGIFNSPCPLLNLRGMLANIGFFLPQLRCGLEEREFVLPVACQQDEDCMS